MTDRSASPRQCGFQASSSGSEVRLDAKGLGKLHDGFVEPAGAGK
jgi:hypothetical protein